MNRPTCQLATQSSCAIDAREMTGALRAAEVASRVLRPFRLRSEQESRGPRPLQTDRMFPQMTNAEAERQVAEAREFFSKRPATLLSELRARPTQDLEAEHARLAPWLAASIHLEQLNAQHRSMAPQVRELQRQIELVIEEREQDRRDAVDRSANAWARRAFWIGLAALIVALLSFVLQLREASRQ